MQTSNYTIQEPQEIAQLIHQHSIEDSEKLLLQVFVSQASFDYLQELWSRLKEHFPKAHIIGASSDGAIVIDPPYTLLSFSIFDETTLHSDYFEHHDHDYDSGEEIAKRFKEFSPKALIIFADAFHTNAEEILKGIHDALPNVIICGGLASRNDDFSDTYIFNHAMMSNSGIVVTALINDNLNIIDNFAFDWVPIGIPKSVTKAKLNRVYEIDNMRAVDFYNKYLGDKIADNLPDTGIEFPLIIQREGQSIGRAVLLAHDDGSLSFAGNIHVGEKVQFGIGDVESIIKHSQNYSKVLDYSNIESIFIYSCTARRHFLNDDIAIELEAFEKFAPTSGFFTFGEFFNRNLLNQSNRYIALSEKPLQSIERLTTNYNHFQDSNKISILRALLNLTNATSRDLDRLNSSLETKVIEQQEDIKRNIYYDDNTKLPNRIKLLNDITWHRGEYLILINIDRFSRINYFYGFEAGDMLIRNLAAFLSLHCKNIGTLYKLPSDEFALIISDKSVKIREWIASISLELKMMLFNYQGIKMPYTVTIGVAKIIGDGISMRHADISINHARLIHKPYAFYEDIEKQNQQTIKDTTALALSLREAIKDNHLCMHYQPIFDLQSGAIYAYEGLARFCTTLDNKMLMPSEFLPILPYIHLSQEFLKMVIDQIFQLFAQHNIRFSINLTIDDILDEDINDFLCTQLQKYALYDRITIEILETVEIIESTEMIEFIDRAKSLGIKIAIDDFGSGFANFEYITKINADILKIDGSLIKNIDQDENAKIVVETIVAFAQKLGMQTVAEYVHSKAIYDIVKELGIDYAQGFYLGKPSPYLLT